MPRQLQIAAGGAALVAAISIGVFLYLTRGIALPSARVQTSAQQLDAASERESTLFRITQDESTVEYTIDEVLNGAPKTVVGTTSEVAGDIVIDLNDLSQTEIGEIAINARTFVTDDERRDNAVARFVLQSEADANEIITFQPTDISDLPSSAEVGDTLDFEVTGDLTVAGTTQPVTFAVTAALETADRLVGHAEATILRSDFNLSIPSVAFVADVEDTSR
ncbi:MAG: YceI family protein [Anaerolineae bacterium]|nr:YceI family protein [Anaerolineae bacterium]